MSAVAIAEEAPVRLGPRGETPGGRVPIRALMALFVAALLLPALIFFGVLLDGVAERDAREAREQADRLAHRVAFAAATRIEAMSAILSVFASTTELEDGGLARLHARAVGALAGTGMNLLVLDEDLRQLLNTRVAYGAPLGRTSNIPVAAHVLETGERLVSDVFIGGVAKRKVFNVMARAETGSGERRVLILTSDTDEFGRVVEAETASDIWRHAVFDGAGGLVFAGAPDPEAVEGCAGSEDFVASVAAIPGSGWSACAWADSGALGQPYDGPRRRFLLAAAALLALGLGAALLVGAVVSRAISRAAAVGRASEPPAKRPASVIREVDEVLAALHQEARARADREAELRLVMRETGHRAKNQIAIATALLRMSARQSASVEEMRDDLARRFAALARAVDLEVEGRADSATLRRLAEAQLATFAERDAGRLLLDGEDVSLSRSAARSLGLVLHELATNASKYGAWSTEAGRVSLSWRRAGEDLDVEWREEGGPPAAQPERTGFGASLIGALVERTFNGRIERSFTAEGLILRLALPLGGLTGA